MDSPGTWETLSSPRVETGPGVRINKPRGMGAPTDPATTRWAQRVVPPSQGNEVRRDGRQGVGARRSTHEGGEPTQRDPLEERACRITELLRGTMKETPSSQPISPGLQRVAELARQAPELAFTTLTHHITLDLLRESYRRTPKDKAPGIDGQLAADYAVDLEDNLRSLLARAKSGEYRAPPVRRVHIPKGDGKSTRPIGIPTFEDKVLQRAVVMVLEAIYE